MHNAIIDRQSKIAEPDGSLDSEISTGSGGVSMGSAYVDTSQHGIRTPLFSESKFYNAALVQAVFEDPKLLKEALESPEMKTLLKLHNETLFITIFCSILQGSFLAYTPSSSGSKSLVIVVFYARLFMDLLGRPLALLPRPQCFQTIEWLLFWSCLRVGMMFFYFLYIAVPEKIFFRSDIFIILFQVIFIIMHFPSHLDSS